MTDSKGVFLMNFLFSIIGAGSVNSSIIDFIEKGTTNFLMFESQLKPTLIVSIESNLSAACLSITFPIPGTLPQPVMLTKFFFFNRESNLNCSFVIHISEPRSKQLAFDFIQAFKASKFQSPSMQFITTSDPDALKTLIAFFISVISTY